jgi:hypothetical protein
MSRHYHATTTADSNQTFELRRHAVAAGEAVRPCDDRSHFVEIRPCPECGQAVAFVAGGQDSGLYRCPNGCTRRIQRVY